MRDWHDRRDSLLVGMIFEISDNEFVRLEGRTPGDGTRWNVSDYRGGGWSNDGQTIEPSELYGDPLKAGELGMRYMPPDLPVPAIGDDAAIRHFAMTCLSNENYLRIYYGTEDESYAYSPIPAGKMLEMTDSGMDVSFISHFPTGTSAVCCTDYARQVANIFKGRVEVKGFANEDNPTSRVAMEEMHPSGHDFAILDDRYIIDLWPLLVLGHQEKVIYDFHDPREMAQACAMYGPPQKWEKLHDNPYPSEAEHQHWLKCRKEVDEAVAGWKMERAIERHISLGQPGVSATPGREISAAPPGFRPRSV